MSDFDQVWIAANALRHGADPYAALRATGWPFPLYYPMTAAVIAMPFALFPVAWARVLFFATGAGLLAWTFAAEPHRRWVFFSGSFLDAFALAQWSPFITGCIELPAFLAGAVLTAKPTVGLALAVAFFLPITRRTWWALSGALTTVVISLILTPSWPINFIAATRNSPHIVAPVTLLPLGPIILLALLRWRRPEARLLACLAVIPQTVVSYSTVPLFLVPKARRETLLLVLLADLVYGINSLLLPLAGIRSESLAARVHIEAQPILALLYIPCVIMVLRRPNHSTDGSSWNRNSDGASSSCQTSASGHGASANRGAA